MSPRPWLQARHALVAAGLALGLGWALTAGSTTRQGIDYEVRTHRIPLTAKVLGFLHRDAEYRLLAAQITAGLGSDQERARALFDWTRSAVRATPRGWPVIDDHILHLIIRGYGSGDQMADVLTTLATYAGLPAFWSPGPVAVSFVQVDGRWTVWDVANNRVFADPEGRLYDVRELMDRPELIQAAAGAPSDDYADLVRGFRVPPVLRARQQMPLPRLGYELRRLILGAAGPGSRMRRLP